MSTSGSCETSCAIRPIGKIGVRSSGPAGWPVAGDSGGSGSPGSSGARLTQCVGMSSSARRNFVGSVMGRSYGGREVLGCRLDLAVRDQSAIDHQIAVVAAAQQGVIDHGQLLAIGLSPAAIGRRIASGSLHPKYRGVYAVGHPMLSPAGRRWAAVRACGAGAALSHVTAGDGWGLRRSASGIIHITVPVHSGRRTRPGLRIHRRTLPDDEFTELDGLRITTPGRTLIDLAAGGLRGRALEAALDHAEQVLQIDWAGMGAILERHARRPGVAALTAVLKRYAPGSVDTRSRLEEIVLELCDEFGLPRPLMNVVVEGKVRDF